MENIALIYFSVVRFVLPLFAIMILAISINTLLHNLKRKTLARFAVDGFTNGVEIKGSECLIGKSIMCDLRLRGSSIKKYHAILTLTDYGFKITPTEPENAVYVNNYKVEGEAYLQSGDKIMIGSTAIKIAINPAINHTAKMKSDKKTSKLRLCNTLCLTLFQIFAAVGYILSDTAHFKEMVIAFGGLIAFEWIYLSIRGFKTNTTVEILAFFLTSVGFCVSASVSGEGLIKKAFFVGVGFMLYLLLSLFLTKLEWVEKLNIPVCIICVALFIFNIVFAVSINGALNWVTIGGISFQPSEFIKVALVFVSACSIEKMVKLKSLTVYLGFVFICLLSLAYMRDFGTAVIYFAAMLVVLALRLCDLKIIGAILGGASVVGLIVIKVIPYVTTRFATYRHAWEYASSGGYQQTQTMMSIASGGLFGLGPQKSHLKNVSAADTDLVFGMIAEELGLIIAVVTALCFLLFVIYASICISRTRSIYYAITASAAATIFMLQASLNIFGSVDLLPLTGVTLPFISNGGSSIIACFMLLAFIKVAGAKFVVLKKGGNG